MKPKRLARSLALALAALASITASAAADTSFPAAAGDLTAQGDLVAWSPWTGPGRLMSGYGATAAALPISAGRFSSIDLGTDARGRSVLLYSACKLRPRRCKLHVYDFSSRRQHRLATLSRSGCSEASARISRGTIVFGRTCRAHRALDGFYLKRPGKRAVRLRGLPTGGKPLPLGLPRDSVRSLDLDGNALAFVELHVSNGPEEATWWETTEVRARTLGRRHGRLLARERHLVAPAESGPYIHDVSVDSGFAYWEEDISGGELPTYRQDIVRRPIDGSGPATRLERAGRLYTDPNGDRLGSYAVSGDRLLYSRPAIPTGSTPFIAQVTGTPVFRPAISPSR